MTDIKAKSASLRHQAASSAVKEPKGRVAIAYKSLRHRKVQSLGNSQSFKCVLALSYHCINELLRLAGFDAKMSADSSVVSSGYSSILSARHNLLDDSIITNEQHAKPCASGERGLFIQVQCRCADINEQQVLRKGSSRKFYIAPGVRSYSPLRQHDNTAYDDERCECVGIEFFRTS